MFFQSAFEVEAPAWLWTRQTWQQSGLERQEAAHNYSMPWQSQGIKVVLFSNKIHECMSSGARTGAGCLHLLLLELEREFLLLWVKHPDICTPRGWHKTVQISPSLSTNMMLTLSSGKWKSWELREVILDSRYNKHYKLKTLKFFLLWGNVVITEHNK